MEKSVALRAMPHGGDSYESSGLLGGCLPVGTVARLAHGTPYELKKSRRPCRDDAAANEKIPRAIDDSCSAARAA